MTTLRPWQSIALRPDRAGGVTKSLLLPQAAVPGSCPELALRAATG